ncbi:hypothetical protein Acr_14g0002090 [Actinidia rufa]|uniref:Uncharacterized protein n=1 Tax=Actinidia rufa TaxID=165716 RepID=A0A7J0FPT8_9ERIC|nr:hypothetical protein Acr_14g0002090 [Actinidia rufa]
MIFDSSCVGMSILALEKDILRLVSSSIATRGEAEKSEEVNLGDPLVPALLEAPRSNSRCWHIGGQLKLGAAFDLGFPLVLLVAEEEIEHSLNIGGANSDSSTEMGPVPKDITPKKIGKGVASKTVQVPLIVQDPVLAHTDLPIDQAFPSKE